MINRSVGGLRNLLIFALSLLFAVFLAEIVLRNLLTAPPKWYFPQESYAYDAEIGHVLISGQHSFTHDRPVAINSAGIRDAEYPRAADPGVYRILALGDSQTFGNGLDLVDTWPKQLEAVLNRNSGDSRYEVLNCGVPGTDTWQHEIFLERMLEYYQADGIILAFYVNDIVVKPHEVRQLQDSGGQSVGKRIKQYLKRSALVMAWQSAIQAVRLKYSPSENYLLNEALYRGDTTPVSLYRWGQVGQYIGGMKKLTDEIGIDFMIISLPRRDQVDGRLPAKSYNENLASIAMRHNIPLMELLGPLQHSYREYGKKLFIPWDGHNSAIANRIIAREVAGEMLTSGFGSQRH